MYPPDAIVDLYCGPALGWVDITEDVRLKSARSGGGITITRGRSPEAEHADPSGCSLVINNRHGTYSPRNPMSPYYGLIGRNTPVRVRLAGLADETSLWASGVAGLASTPDDVALDITGDLDVRVDASLVGPWRVDYVTWLASRWRAAGDQRSWGFAVADNGTLYAIISRDGTVDGGQLVTVTGTTPVTPGPDGRLVVRYTLDADNGLGGRTHRFWQGPTIDGPWTLLDEIVNTTGGPLTIHASTAPLEIGMTDLVFTTAAVWGEVHRMQVRSGIDGTVVADPDCTALETGETTFVDTAGRVWTINPQTIVYDRQARVYGEVVAWPPRWDTSGADRWVPIEAAGVTRRLGQGVAPLRSPIYRTLNRAQPAAWLPLEDGSDASVPASAATGVPAGVAVGVEFAADDTLPGAATTAKLATDTSEVATPVPVRDSGVWTALLYFRLPAIPAGPATLVRVATTGTVVEWSLQITDVGYWWRGVDVHGATVSERHTAFGPGASPDRWIAMQLQATQDGPDVRWSATWHAVGSRRFFGGLPSTYPGSVGAVTRARIVGATQLVDALVGHLAVIPQAWSLADSSFADASNGYIGERSLTRLTRLATEEGVPMIAAGSPERSEALGRQTTATFLDLVREIATTDGGILFEPRGALGLAYRSRASLYNQTPLELSYAAGHIHPPFEPVDDDAHVRNDVTVSRPNGSSARSVLESGPLSVLPPPAGVGVYDTSVTINVADDQRLPDQAGWRRHLGTVDEHRYPSIPVNLAGRAWRHDPALTERAARVDAGDVLAVDDLPAWLPPGPAVAMVQGYTEVIDTTEWDITWSATPASPWTVATIDGPARVVAVGSTLAADIDADDLTMQVTFTAENGPWTTNPDRFPMHIRVGGEQVTAAAISGDTSPQTVTLSARAVNGVVRGWPAGTEVNVWQPAVVAL